ncbi:MAG: hypothetical protein M3438_05680 [Pseudomonadota bacterium]|nr:hypothetical protein [Pseudomonadota bacterium]
MTATGTASDGAVPTPTDQGLSLTSTGPLTVTLSGQIVTTEGPPFNRIRNFPAAVSINYLNSSPAFPVRDIGAVIYTSTGTTISEGNNTLIRGTTVTATTGTVIVNGANAMGVFSVSTDGLTIINGGTTTLANPASTAAVGIFSTAIGGANVVNTGVVTVAGVGRVGGVPPENLGVHAVSTASTLGVCGSTTVNVTGNVTVSNGTAIRTDSCGASTVNVDAGRTVRTTTGTTILNTATSAATTNVSGTVDGGAANIAIDANGTSSATIVAATGAVIGRFDGTGGADIFTNNGAFTTSGISDFQAGADVFTNNGTLTASGATTLAGLETLANAGTISLMNGATGDVLTLAGNYSGTGAARLLLDVNATGADRIVIGGAASGSTSISLNRIGGAPLINTTGLLLVDAGTASSGAFTLAGASLSSGFINVSLEQRGADFFLVATPNVAAFQPLALSNIAKDMWYQSGDVYTAYAALRRNGLGASRSRPSLWGQLYASRGRSGERDAITAFGGDFDIDNRIRTDQRGAQVGLDFQPTVGNVVIGFTAGYQRAEADFRSGPGGFLAKGFNVGTYVIVGRATGLYGGLLAKFDENHVRIGNGAFGDADGSPDFTSGGIEGEAGYRFAPNGLNLDFGAGLARVNTRINRFDAAQIGYDFDNARSLRGRLGARVGLGGRWGPYLDGKLFHEFYDDARVTFINGSQRSAVETEGRGTWGRVEAGIGGHDGKGPIAALWGEIGDVKGVGARAGFRF